MSLSRILIIDDQHGGVDANGRNRLREDFCLRVGLQDVTGDMSAEQQEKPIAEAVFCRGQVNDGYEVSNNLNVVFESIRAGWRECPRWAMLFLDLHFKTGLVNHDGETKGTDSDRDPENYFGLTVLEKIWHDPDLQDIPIVILSSMDRDEVEHRFAGMKHSVSEFIDKTEIDRTIAEQILQDHGLIADDRIIGHSLPLLKCLKEARKRARMGNDNILLLGETGTGKELLARYIHDNSTRSSQPYETVYTQGVPVNLIEDRLFGHEKGAYTGASSAESGAGEKANGGTLFIDEFGEVPATAQSKLLRLLDKNTRETQRLGASKAQKVDIQVVLATNQVDLLSYKDFRPDLLYRVKADEPVFLPPLRKRLEDIPLLVEYFVRKCEDRFRKSMKTEQRDITSEAMRVLCEYSWPGNIRQLERVIESAVYRWPRLRKLSVAHLIIPDMEANTESNPSSRQQSSTSSTIPSNFDNPKEILQLFANINFDPYLPVCWTGLAPELQKTFAIVYAKLLRTALIATQCPTLSNPDGEIKIHPAMKLITGDKKLTATKAADAIKRIITLDKPTQAKSMNDPILSKAYERALELRPKVWKKSQ